MIKIKRIKVSNFRKLKDIEVTLDDHFTVIAGSNNSGKTSLVELLKHVLVGGRNLIKMRDLNIEQQKENLKILNEVLKQNVQATDKLLELKEKLSTITLDIDVEYGENDDIQLFSDYLMDLNEENRQFYFRYTCPYPDKLLKDWTEQCEITEEQYRTRSYDRFEEAFHFTDKDRTILNNNTKFSSGEEFRKLFGFESVYATRTVDDVATDNSQLLSKKIFSSVLQNEDIQEKITELTSSLKKNIEENQILDEVSALFTDEISQNLSGISNITGQHITKIKHEVAITDNITRDFINKSSQLYIQDGDLAITESQQGLGFSNMLYLFVVMQNVIKNIDMCKANLVFFEEIEAHLHPQMIKIFMNVLRNEKNIQMCCTTHSSEIIKNVDLESIRVLRFGKLQHSSSVFDINYFLKNETKNGKFYKKFFRYTMSDVFFADKVIMFEGDAERILFERLIQIASSNPESPIHTLSNSYISYIQVGGAYAYKYVDLMKSLKIKTLIFTDIDYTKKSTPGLDVKKILSQKSSNQTFKDYYKRVTIQAIYNCTNKVDKAVDINVFTQNQEDGYARSLEDAILFTINKDRVVNVHSVIPKLEWQSSNFEKFGINGGRKQKVSLYERSEQINSKTDFMYAYLDYLEEEREQGKNIEDKIPNYIVEGLTWLAK